MSNRAYLICTDFDSLYPSETDEAFAAETNVVAQGIYRVPLLWFGLFRSADLRAQALEIGGELQELKAPRVAVSTALQQLALAIPQFEQMFADQESLRDHLRDHAQSLLYAVAAMQRKFVTVEWVEVECLVGPSEFGAMAKLAIGSLDGYVPLPVGRKALLKLSELDAGDESEVVAQLLGTAWLRPVPWENA